LNAMTTRLPHRCWDCNLPRPSIWSNRS
jgi:hypothetical protein